MRLERLKDAGGRPAPGPSGVAGGDVRQLVARAAADEPWRRLVEQLPSITYLAAWDEQSSCLYISPQVETILGYPASAWTDDPAFWMLVLHPDDRARVLHQRPDDRARVLAETRRCFELEQPFACEYRMVAADGRTVWIEEQDAIVRDQHGVPVYTQAVMIDATVRRRQVEELERAHRVDSLGELAAGIAHDFNNLLSVILSSAQFAAGALPTGDPGREDVEQVIKAARHAAELTKQLLLFSRQQTLEPQPIDLNEAVANAHGLLARTLGGNIRLEVRLAESLPHVALAPGQAEQVLLNLAVNARDAMPDGGMLWIETRALPSERSAAGVERPPAVELAVTDSGHGMDERTRELACDPFFTTKPRGQGTGLGLATVYAIATKAGGQVEIESAEQQGTLVRVKLPAHQPDSR